MASKSAKQKKEEKLKGCLAGLTGIRLLIIIFKFKI